MFNVYSKRNDLFVDRIHIHGKEAAEQLAFCLFGSNVYLIEVK